MKRTNECDAHQWIFVVIRAEARKGIINEHCRIYLFLAACDSVCVCQRAHVRRQTDRMCLANLGPVLSSPCMSNPLSHAG